MTILITKIDDKYLEDCKRIQRILFEHGTDESLSFARTIWGHISVFFYEADWAELPSMDEDVYDIINNHTTVALA